MAKKFGLTWWGNEWLRSLTHIDCENRIPRGATYARNGYVEEVKLVGNRIKAKVLGHSYRPYSVSISIPAFTESEVNLLMDGLMEHPELISSLVNRVLDPEILTIAKECNLKIFPERWSDLRMKCSCPDWAVPCKHLAAVVYMFSREIDNNPFIAFLMHNVDLLAELRKRGVDVDSIQQDVSVMGIENIVHVKSEKSIPKNIPAYKRIDFSLLTDKSDAMFMLLSDNPPFFPKSNFKDIYVDELKRIKKKVQRFLSGKIGISDLFPAHTSDLPDISVDDEFSLCFDFNLHWTVKNVFSSNDSAKRIIYDIDTLPSALLRINPDFLQDYHPSVIALYQCLMCAVHLLALDSIAPQSIRLSDNTYALRWIPAYIDSQVHDVMTNLDAGIPDGLVVACSADCEIDKSEYIYDSGEWAVSFFLNELVKNLSSVKEISALASYFFKGSHFSFNGVGETEIPGGIKSWTSSYTLSSTDYRPVFSIEESTYGGFDMYIGVEDKREKSPHIISLTEILGSSSYKFEKFRVLRSFTLISGLLKEVNEYIKCGARRPIHYTEETFVPFLMNIVPVVRMLDIKVFMPKSLQELIRPKVSMSIKRKPNSENGFLSLSDFFDFNWAVALGDDVVTLDEFSKLHKEAGGLIKYKQHYMYIDADLLKKLHDAFLKPERLSPAQLLQVALAEEYNSAPVYISDEVRKLIDELAQQEIIPLPAELNASLRPYQLRGYSWMYRNMRIGFGSILADDMGLGKTLQSIALILKIKEEGVLNNKQVLIVVPTGLLTNWQAEINRFAPSLTVFVYHGTKRELDKFDADVLLTTYGVLRSDNAALKKRKWALMFIDEAQNIKNSDTAQSKAVHAIPASAHIALSGTPVENRLTEFWSIMEYANKGYLGTLKSFKENFANPIHIYNDAKSINRFRKITAPFMMRRMKTDKSIIADLPDKIELDDYASLKPEQAALYYKTLELAMAEIEGLSTTEHESLFKRQGLILQMILALKQICNHPAQFLKNGDFRADLSGKTDLLLERIECIVDSGEKVLVFTQFREMGDLLVRFIEERIGKRPLFYHGGCTVKERQEMVDRFQNNRSDKVFILSLKAAGTGLNLTAASHVIHYDLWWNPAVEAQATDRAYRIGQQKNVAVHRFITKGTFEERINDMIMHKKHLAEMTVATGESWIGKLSNKELREIFG